MDKIVEQLAGKIDDILFHVGGLEGYKNKRCTDVILIAVLDAMIEIQEKSVEDMRKVIGN